MTHIARFSRPARLVILAGLALSWGVIAFPNFAAHADEPTTTCTSSPTSTLLAPTSEINSPTPTITFTAISSATATPTPTTISTPTSTRTFTPTFTPTQTPTGTPTLPITTSPLPPTPLPQSILINEIAWAGTLASSYDEWIELYNPGHEAIDLTGWVLSDEDDINIQLTGTLPAYSFFLLERTDDSTVADITANYIYSGSLKNSGERLQLIDSTGNEVDSANRDRGDWSGGDATSRASMERRGGTDLPENWGTFTGNYHVGHDADGNRIPGTPLSTNSLHLLTPTSTSTMSSLTPTSTPTASRTPTSMFSATNTASETYTSTSTPSQTSTATITPTPTADETAKQTPTNTPTPSITYTAPPQPTPYLPQSIIINEIAWAGTVASSNDEWIELYNPGSSKIDLAGWTLTNASDINVVLSGSLSPYGFYLLERTDNTTIADLTADIIYTGSLKNSGETLSLRDPMGTLVDTANFGGREGWPGGDASSRASMERIGHADIPDNWQTFAGFGGVGHDANGNLINGTPRQTNSIFLSTPTAPTLAPTPYPPRSVLINEVAWAGTLASSNDEWIELYNPGHEEIDLSGWILYDGGNINVHLKGTIPAFNFFLLERTDDNTISDITANLIYSGGLKNGGERLIMIDPTGNEVDSANREGGSWSGGDSTSHASMERRGGTDLPENWGTFTGYHGVGHDAAGNPIAGTPRSTNSLHFPTPVPTWIPGKVVINEVLARPHFDWEGTGGVDSNDEFIELYNLGPSPVYLRGWLLDDIPEGGSRPYTIPGVTISPGGYAVFFHSRTHITLNDSGDSVRLLAPNGKVIDKIQYLTIRASNLSYGRLPDGSGHLEYGLWPTPGNHNELFEEATPDPTMESAFPILCPNGGRPQPRLPRAARHASQLGWFIRMGLIFCH